VNVEYAKLFEIDFALFEIAENRHCRFFIDLDVVKVNLSAFTKDMTIRLC
jgi:hypothetical protein